MKVGTALNMLSEPGRPDASVIHEHFAMGDLAEPLGFDSLMALEHHFTGYAMSPAPLQLLAYFAGRTKRITLGTAVVVLPWHDPIRVAEEIALLDIMCGGRCMFGFGRGAASVEYEGFGIPMGEARGRFEEAARIIVAALSQPSFEFQGQYFKIARTSIRPRPISHPERRFYASSVSPQSAELMARLGFSMLLIMQNEWSKCKADIDKFYDMAAAAGHAPHRPIILTNVSCAPTRAEAEERAHQYLGAKWDSIENHYHFGDGHLAKVKGYESYEALAKTYSKLKDPVARRKATDFYVSIQITGTPADCLEKIAELHRVANLEHLICEFAWGGLPHHMAETNMRLFASDVLPVLQRDPAYALRRSTAEPLRKGPAHENMFAPA